MELINAIRTELKQYKLPIYINNSQTFKRTSFYVKVEDKTVTPESDFVEHTDYRITIRYFGKMDNYNVVDILDIQNMESELDKLFKKTIGGYRITSKTFEKDFNGDLVFTIYIKTNTTTLYKPQTFLNGVEYNVVIEN